MPMTGFLFSISCLRFSIFCILLLALAACGGGEGSDDTPAGEIGTLAYVNTTCRDDPTGFTLTQELRVQRGDAAPIPVSRLGPFGPLSAGPCSYFGNLRAGSVNSPAIGAFQRLGVSPDGTRISFEISDDYYRFGQTFVPPEEEGIFSIRPDGNGLRPLGRASRAAAATVVQIESNFVFS